MVKYREAVAEMINRNKELFSEFDPIYKCFAADQKSGKAEFDEVGRKIVRVIEETENRLCARMEGSGRGNYSTNLAEKFRQEVRKIFPLIDLVGVTISS